MSGNVCIRDWIHRNDQWFILPWNHLHSFDVIIVIIIFDSSGIIVVAVVEAMTLN